MNKEFKDYKKKQKYYKNLSENSAKLFYDSGKRTDKHGVVIKKGTPYVKQKEVTNE